MKSFCGNSIVGMFCGLVLLTSACTNLDEFDSSRLADPVALSVVVAQVGDSAARITAINPSDGYITLGLLEDPGVELDLDAETFFTRNYEGIKYVTVKATKNKPLQVDFKMLVQNTDYVVYGVSSNADGVVGEIVNLSFTTNDSHSPNLVSTSPKVGLIPEMTLNGRLVLEFDEPVTYDSTKLLQYYFYNDDVKVFNKSLHVTVAGNLVTITSDSLARNAEIVFVSWADSAFKDASGNAVKAMSSYMDGEDYPHGLYFTTESKDFVPTITPVVGETVSVADLATIVLTFDEAVVGFHDDYEAGSTLTYKDADGSTVTKVLKQTDFSYSGKTVTLTAPMTAVSGQTVTLILKASTFYVGIYNPNAAIKVSWVVE